MLLLRANRKPLSEQVNPRQQVRFYLTLAVLVLASTQLHHIHFLNKVSGLALDSSLAGDPRKPDHCVLFLVTQNTVVKHFNGRALLDPATLFKAIEELDKLGPAVIAIDFFTEADAYRSLSPPATHAALVWAQGERQKVLGRSSGAVVGGSFGISRLNLDGADEPIRTYREFFDEQSTLPSFPRAIIEAFCQTRATDARCAAALARRGPESHYIQFFDDTEWRPLDLVLDHQLGRQPGFEKKIFILGGSYGSDIHPTPFVSRLGSSIVMSEVESSLSGVRREVPGWVVISIKVILGFCISLIHRNFMPFPAAGITLLIAGMVVFGGVRQFAWTGYWVDLVIILIGVWIEQLYETVELAHHQITH